MHFIFDYYDETKFMNEFISFLKLNDNFVQFKWFFTPYGRHIQYAEMVDVDDNFGTIPRVAVRQVIDYYTRFGIIDEISVQNNILILLQKNRHKIFQFLLPYMNKIYNGQCVAMSDLCFAIDNDEHKIVTVNPCIAARVLPPLHYDTLTTPYSKIAQSNGMRNYGAYYHINNK